MNGGKVEHADVVRVAKAKNVSALAEGDSLGDEVDILVEDTAVVWLEGFLLQGSCDIPDCVQVGEDEGLLRDDTTSNDIFDVVLAHLLVVSEEIKRLLGLDLFHELLLLLGVSFKEVFFIVSDLDDERNVEDPLQVTDTFISHASR